MEFSILILLIAACVLAYRHFLTPRIKVMEQTQELHGEGMTTLEKLINEDTTKSRLLEALMEHDVLLALEAPSDDDPSRSVPLRLNDGSGDCLLAATSMRVAELFGEAVESQGGGASPFTHVARLQIFPLVLERFQDVGIRLIGRSPAEDSFNAVLIEADTLAEVRANVAKLANEAGPKG